MRKKESKQRGKKKKKKNQRNTDERKWNISRISLCENQMEILIKR